MVADAGTPLSAAVSPELERVRLLAFRLHRTHLPVGSHQFAIVVALLALQIPVVHPASFAYLLHHAAKAFPIFDNLTAHRHVYQSHLVAIGNILHSPEDNTLTAIHEADIISLGNLCDCGDHVVSSIHQKCIYFHSQKRFVLLWLQR